MNTPQRLVIVKGMIAWITRKGAGETGKKAQEILKFYYPGAVVARDW